MGVWDLGLLLTYVGQVTLPLETAVFIKWGGRSPVAAAMRCGSEAWPAPASRTPGLGGRSLLAAGPSLSRPRFF